MAWVVAAASVVVLVLATALATVQADMATLVPIRAMAVVRATTDKELTRKLTPQPSTRVNHGGKMIGPNKLREKSLLGQFVTTLCVLRHY